MSAHSEGLKRARRLRPLGVLEILDEALERMNDAGARREPHLAEENVEKSETD